MGKQVVRTISGDIPESHCWNCNAPLRMAASIQPDKVQTPKPGDYSICFHCGAPAEFDEALRLVKPSDADIAEFLQSETYREMHGKDYMLYVFPEGMRGKAGVE